MTDQEAFLQRCQLIVDGARDLTTGGPKPLLVLRVVDRETGEAHDCLAKAISSEEAVPLAILVKDTESFKKRYGVL